MENNERTKRICELWRDINVTEGNQSNQNGTMEFRYCY